MKKAFTLVEILVVVTIISLLASIAAVSYAQFVKQARDSRRKTDIEQIRAAIELYRNFNTTGEYPALITTGSDIKDAAPPNTVYLSKVPDDPLSSRNYKYYYQALASNKDYILCASLETGGTVVNGTNCGTPQCNYCMGPYGQK